MSDFPIKNLLLISGVGMFVLALLVFVVVFVLFPFRERRNADEHNRSKSKVNWRKR
jgi:hypothetical protein